MNAHALILFLYCFAQMETGNGVPYKPGAHRERGRWQLTEAVRIDRTRDLLAKGYKGTIHDETLAAAQVEWIYERLVANGCAHPTPFDIGLAWNAGVHGKLSGTAPNSAYDYAARFSALVVDRNK